jgi:hypothetical protein
MVCPNCESIVELTWTRYLKSLSGRHDCPRCDTKFKFRIPRRYWLLWLDVFAGGVFTTLGLNYLLGDGSRFAHSDTAIMLIVVVVPVLIWGSIFMVLNRKILNRLETESLRESG